MVLKWGKVISPCSDKLRDTVDISILYAKNMQCKINIKNTDHPIVTRFALHTDHAKSIC